jgi:hypothetical protein
VRRDDGRGAVTGSKREGSKVADGGTDARAGSVIRRRSWPRDPELAIEILRAELPGWHISHQSGHFRATLNRETGRSTVEAPCASAVALTIDALFEEAETVGLSRYC